MGLLQSRPWLIYDRVEAVYDIIVDRRAGKLDLAYGIRVNACFALLRQIEAHSINVCNGRTMRPLTVSTEPLSND